MSEEQASQEVHYFATNAFAYGVGATREAAIQECVRRVGNATLRTYVTNPKTQGLYVWTCRVKAPQSTAYAIENYIPKDVEIESTIEAHVVNMKGHCRLLDN